MKTILSKAKTVALQYLGSQFVHPTSGRIIVTSNCPLRCKMCTFWQNKHEDPSLELIQYWIKELAEIGIKNIAIGGGEPFIRKDLTEIAKSIKSYGIRCSVTTSGYLVGKVPFPPVDECVVSLDGATRETHDAIRGMNGCFEKAVNAINAAKKHCLVKQVNFVLQKDNYHELLDFLKLAKQLEIQVSLIPVSQKLAAQNPLSQNLIEFDLPKLKQILDEAFAFGNILNNRAFIDLFLAKLEKGAIRHSCMAPYNCILIYSNGDIYPCGNLDITVGNLDFGSRLSDIYADYEALRKEIRSGQHPFCNKCIYPDITNRQTLRSGTSLFIQKRLAGNAS